MPSELRSSPDRRGASTRNSTKHICESVSSESRRLMDWNGASYNNNASGLFTINSAGLQGTGTLFNSNVAF